MAAIGILGGMGPQASARLQQLLVRDAPKHMTIRIDTDFPEIVLLSVPVPNFIANKRHMNKAREILIQRTKLLETAGCVINGIACNTAHLLLPELQAATTTPFVSIPILTAQKVEELGAKRVGLLGTPNTLKSKLYDNALGANIELIRPTTKMIDRVEQLIFRQLQGQSNDGDSLELRRITTQFLEEARLDAVILGCTELPLIFGESADQRIIDTLAVLSEGLLKEFVKLKK